MITKNIGMLLLAIYLIAVGILTLTGLGIGILAGVLALAQLFAVRRVMIGLGPAAAEAFLAAGVTVALAAAVASLMRAR